MPGVQGDQGETIKLMNESIFKTTPCDACGRPILWAQDDKGGSIPLDLSAPVYHLVAQDVHGGWRVCRDSTARVSHFSTCPRASDFSGLTIGGTAS